MAQILFSWLANQSIIIISCLDLCSTSDTDVLNYEPKHVGQDQYATY